MPSESPLIDRFSNEINVCGPGHSSHELYSDSFFLEYVLNLTFLYQRYTTISCTYRISALESHFSVFQRNWNHTLPCIRHVTIMEYFIHFTCQCQLINAESHATQPVKTVWCHLWFRRSSLKSEKITEITSLEKSLLGCGVNQAGTFYKICHWVVVVVWLGSKVRITWPVLQSRWAFLFCILGAMWIQSMMWCKSQTSYGAVNVARTCNVKF